MIWEIGDENTGGAEQSDDITMLGFTYAPPESGPEEAEPSAPVTAEDPA